LFLIDIYRKTIKLFKCLRLTWRSG